MVIENLRIEFAEAFRLRHRHLGDLSIYPAKNSSTAFENSCGACSNIQCRAPGTIAVLASGICSASTRHSRDDESGLSPPPISSVGVLIDCASAFAKGFRFSP